MDNLDDDIFILSGHDTLDGSITDTNPRLLAQDFVISRAPGARQDPAVQILQQAYADLKKRFNESEIKREQMSRALRDVGRLKNPDVEMATYGDHTDSYNSQGAAATAEHPSAEHDNLRAQQGYIRYLEREKMSNEAKLQQFSSLKSTYETNCKAMQLRLKETVTELQRKEEDLKHAHETIKDLKEENMQLKDDRDAFRKHATEMQEVMQNTMQQTSAVQQKLELEDLKVKHQHLETLCTDLKRECDRLKVSEGLAQADLQAANKKMQDLQQNLNKTTSKCALLEDKLQLYEDSDLSSVSSIPTAQELLHLKRVIADLKKTVVQQREFLSKLGKTSGNVFDKSKIGIENPNRLVNDDVGLSPSWEDLPCSSGRGTYVQDGVPASPRKTLADDSQVHPSNSWNSPPRRSNSATNASQSGNSEQEHSRSEVLLRRTSAKSHNCRQTQSEILARTTDDPHTNDGPPLGDSTWQQQTLNNIGHMNGGTAQYQSTYENTRGMAPQAVVTDLFGELDTTPAFPVPPELRPNTVQPTQNQHRDSAKVNGEAGSAEKICPVCSRDFATMPMEDFQTHVFECFDDQQSAPETLRAADPTERICPMCNALFPEGVPQEEFEKHVQEHFDQEIIDRFEILNP